jgi:cysteine desulfurase / selenocysteine lyase
MFDYLHARNDTPGCARVLHFNNAGAALMPRPVLDAVTAHLQLEAETGGYEAAEYARDAIEHMYDAVSVLIGCHRQEVAFIESATRAWDMAFYAIPFSPGDRILTSMAEYASNYLAFLQVTMKTGATVEVIPNDSYGQISIDALREAIDERVKLVSITHVPTNGGLVNPVAEVGAITREAGILFLLDACQSIGQIPIDVEQIGCDLLSACGRKYLRGPRGTGFLYVRSGVLEQLEPPLLGLDAAQWVDTNTYKLSPDARRFECWETNCAAKIGLGVAIDYALRWGIDTVWERIAMLGEKLRQRLEDFPGITVQDLGRERCGIVTFTVAGREPEEIYRICAAHRINVWVSLLSSSRLDMEVRGLASLVRASLHYYNSEEEIEQFCSLLKASIYEAQGWNISRWPRVKEEAS